MIRKRPWMVIIAGPNGAGKSTFYDKVIKDDPLMKNAPFINLDNIAKDMSAPDQNPNDNMLSAGKITYEEVEKHIESRRSFVYETTSSGKVHLRFMDEARKQGFKIATVFIGLSDPLLSYYRVKSRVINGGHDVPYEDIIRRYPKIMKNFPEMLKRSDIAAVFDNSSHEPYKLIFLMDDKAFRIFYQYPSWLEESIRERKTRKDMVFAADAIDVHHLNDTELRLISDLAFTPSLEELASDNYANKIIGPLPLAEKTASSLPGERDISPVTKEQIREQVSKLFNSEKKRNRF